jgi:hypothetical protein
MRAARASEFSGEVAVARVSRGGVYGVFFIAPLARPLIFIEHANGLHHRRPISTLIWLGSTPYGP